MRVLKIRQKLNERGLLLLEGNRCWIITNNGSPKNFIRHEFAELDEVEAWVAVQFATNRLTEEECDEFDQMFKDFVFRGTDGND